MTTRSGSLTQDVVLGALGGTVNTDGNSITFSGSISGAGGLTLNDSTGNGTLILSGANAYTGTTTISSGILSVASGSSTGTGDLALSGGVLSVAGNNQILNVDRDFTQSGGSVLFTASNPVQGTTYQILTVDGTATLGGTLEINVGGSTPGQPFTLMLAATTIMGTFANVFSNAPDAVNISQTLSSDDRSLAVTVTPLVTYDDWKATYNVTTPATATPQNDGVPNLLKYVYHIDPTVPVSSTDRAALPAMGLDTTTTPGTSYLTLTYRQYAMKTGIATGVQTSPDLQTWTTVTPDLSQQVGTDSVTGDPLMEVGVIMPANVTSMFIRLNVTQQ